MLQYLTALQSERDALTQAANTITEKAAEESRSVTDAERASLTQMQARCAEIDTDLVTFNDQLKSQRAYAALRGELSNAGAETRKPREGDGEGDGGERKPTERKGWGAAFISSAEFRQYDGHGSTRPLRLPGVFSREAITLGDGFGLPAQPYTANIPSPAITSPLLDAVGHMSTNSNVVQWLVEPGSYPQAQVVAEGAAKPEADITVDTNTGTLQTYAHWKGITRQALSNIPMIQSIIETQLRGGIFSKLEVDIAAALAAGTFNTVPAPAATAGGALAGIRQAMGEVQAAGFPNANTVLLNPTDWAALDVAVMMGTNGGPSSAGAFWGLSPVASAAVPVGTMYVGDLKNAVTVFDEGQAAVYMTDSHADYFVKNTLVILAEVMALVMVTQGACLAKVTTASGEQSPAPAAA